MIVVGSIVGATVPVVRMAVVVVGAVTGRELPRIDRPAVTSARDHRAVAVTPALYIRHRARAVRTARAVTLDLDLLPVPVVPFALEVPAGAVALGLSLVVRGLTIAAGDRGVPFDRVDPTVVHLVGLVGGLARPAAALDVAIHIHFVARLGDIPGGRPRVPAPGFVIGGSAGGVAGGRATGRGRAAIGAADRASRSAPSATASAATPTASAAAPLGEGGRIGHHQEQHHGRADGGPRPCETVMSCGHQRAPPGVFGFGCGGPSF